MFCPSNQYFYSCQSIYYSLSAFLICELIRCIQFFQLYLQQQQQQQQGGGDQSSGHNGPPAKRVRVMAPTTSSSNSSMVSGDCQVTHMKCHTFTRQSCSVLSPDVVDPLMCCHSLVVSLSLVVWMLWAVGASPCMGHSFVAEACMGFSGLWWGRLVT